MPRAKNRIRECQHCGITFELGSDSAQFKYCSVSCRQKWHYNRWKSNGGKRDPDKVKSYWLKHSYGITLEDYNAMLNQQGNKCACCETAEPTGYNWHVDHCHKTGKVRALLCSKCNQGIGLFDESVLKLEQAIKYIRKHNGN